MLEALVEVSKLDELAQSVSGFVSHSYRLNAANKWRPDPSLGCIRTCLACAVERAAKAALREMVKACAKVALAHVGSAEKSRLQRGVKLGHLDESAAEAIRNEERGEKIASEMIAAAIRALAPEEEKP